MTDEDTALRIVAAGELFRSSTEEVSGKRAILTEKLREASEHIARLKTMLHDEVGQSWPRKDRAIASPLRVTVT